MRIQTESKMRRQILQSQTLRWAFLTNLRCRAKTQLSGLAQLPPQVSGRDETTTAHPGPLQLRKRIPFRYEICPELLLVYACVATMTGVLRVSVHNSLVLFAYGFLSIFVCI